MYDCPVTCTRCGNLSNTPQEFHDLTVEIVKTISVQDAVDNFFEEDKIDEYNCAICADKTQATKRFFVEQFPNVLTVQLNRLVQH